MPPSLEHAAAQRRNDLYNLAKLIAADLMKDNPDWGKIGITAAIYGQNQEYHWKLYLWAWAGFEWMTERIHEELGERLVLAGYTDVSLIVTC